jgi:hypothetical protein
LPLPYVDSVTGAPAVPPPRSESIVWKTAPPCRSTVSPGASVVALTLAMLFHGRAEVPGPESEPDGLT